MILLSSESSDKGWLVGPWNSELGLSVGYANKGIDEPHVHSRITEIYLVAKGEAKVQVGLETVVLLEGDVLVVEPGEGHTFLWSSDEYFHFVIHHPGLSGDEVVGEKRLMSRKELGL